MGKLIMEDEMRIRIGDTVCQVKNENGVETRTMWKVEAVQVVKTEFNFDLKVWCPYSHSWVYAHEDIDIVIHPVDIEDRPCQTFRKIEDNNWEEF